MINGRYMKTGFTIIELLVVVATSAVLLAISAGVFLTINKRGDVDSEARKLKSVLNLARNQTVASEGSQSFGVHIDDSLNEYILFPGSSFDSIHPDNETFTLPSQISISSVELNGGGNDVIFNRLTGSTVQYGHIILESLEKPTTICLSESGSIYIEESGCADPPIEYTGGTTDADLASFPANSEFGYPAQSFTVGADDIYIRRVDLYMRRATSTSPSDIHMEIRETSTVGNVLGRSWRVTGSSLPTNLSWVPFTFPSPIFLSTTTQYFLRLRSLPSSNIASFGASGTIHWAYEHSASSPPAYGGGDAWRYVGRLDNPSDPGQQLGPVDQYDFSFRIILGIDPPTLSDSRHLEFDLGWSISGASTLTLTFHDPGNPDVVESVSMASFFNTGNTEFDWEGSVDVYGDNETLRIHTHYLDSNDTILSIDRERDTNSKAVDISIDSNAIVSYAADGTPTVGASGGVMVYR